MTAPLADRLRPTTLDEVVGQRHLLGPGKILREVAQTGNIPNLIFYGPAGVGKTTVARILAKGCGKPLHKLNGTSCSTSDLKEVVSQRDTIEGRNGVILYLDEIQYLNKKQQQTLLEYMEDGSITLIASTTENPYFYVYTAILSRSTVFEFKPVEPQDIRPALDRGIRQLEQDLGCAVQGEEDALQAICTACGGDVRKALNILELVASAAPEVEGVRTLTPEVVAQATQRAPLRYDRDADEHYDILSAFQKSIRGSDENAGLHYLARLLEAGDLISPCRRLLVMASEDVGLAYPQAASIVKACVDSAFQLGLPEARIPLAQAVILLCTAPKSNSAIMAIDAALADVRKGNIGNVPLHLKDCHYEGAKKLGRGGYQYAHDFPNGYVSQQYLPDAIKDRVYYHFGANKTEQAALAYRQKILQAEQERLKQK